jgi:hypothetical protein
MARRNRLGEQILEGGNDTPITFNDYFTRPGLALEERVTVGPSIMSRLKRIDPVYALTVLFIVCTGVTYYVL